ncbi:unnamed protein product [Lactuca saligna]|uniref:Integrase catalytic domain-containing protein n=1 Tax=Lactuca saligna TaxID=75948 RepID=A0AA35VEI6_LACSI|nr:unnamed protein product [Lactuca saligna]
MCSACEHGKQTKSSFKPKSCSSIYVPLHLLHMDLFGPIPVRSQGGNKYTLVVMDEFTQFTWVAFLKKKGQAAQEIISLIRQNETLTARQLISDANETLETEDYPKTDVPFSNNTSVSNPLESTPGYRDHPVDQIIGNLHDGVRTRSRVSNNFCMYVNFVSMIIPDKIHSTLQEADWSKAMQDELNEYERHKKSRPSSKLFSIYIKAKNVVFNPDIPDVHRGLGLDDFVNFLVSCRLRYVISEVPSDFFPKQVCEFYYTVTVNDENNVISRTIGRGRRSVIISTDLLSAALRLPISEPFSELPTIECCRRLFDQLGYDHSKADARLALILRQCMTPGWKFFTRALCKCVGHKYRSGDQLSTYEQQVVCSLLLNKRLDYGAFFFDQLVQLLRANVRVDHVPFPRWIALVLDKFFAEAYYSHSRNPIQCPRMSVRMYQDDPLENDIGISDQMREWIANPYTVPSLSTDTDEGVADINNTNPEIQADPTQEGGHTSPQLSHHTISVTERIPSAHGEPSAQGEQPS